MVMLARILLLEYTFRRSPSDPSGQFGTQAVQPVDIPLRCVTVVELRHVFDDRPCLDTLDTLDTPQRSLISTRLSTTLGQQCLLQLHIFRRFVCVSDKCIRKSTPSVVNRNQAIDSRSHSPPTTLNTNVIFRRQTRRATPCAARHRVEISKHCAPLFGCD